jgi:hypothetical protein
MQCYRWECNFPEGSFRRRGRCRGRIVCFWKSACESELFGESVRMESLKCLRKELEARVWEYLGEKTRCVLNYVSFFGF